MQCIFTIWIIWPCPSTRIPASGIIKFEILVDPSLFTISLSELCPRVEKKIFKDIVHFHYTTYMATLQHKNPSSRGHEIYKFGRPILGNHYYTCNLSEPSPEVEKKIFKEIHQLYRLIPKFPPLGVGGHEIYNFLSPYLTDVTNQIWLRLAQYFLRRKC